MRVFRSRAARAHQELEGIRSPLAQYQSWTKALLARGILPDVSVIDCQGKGLAEVASLANQAHGARIVLLGSDAPRIGLPVVPTGSRLAEAVDEALHDSGFGHGRLADTMPSPLLERANQ